MQIFHRVSKLWRNLFDKQHVDRDLDDELRSYQDMLADENARSGMNLPDARRKAAVETGSIEQIKEQVREVRIGFQSTRFPGTCDSRCGCCSSNPSSA